MKNQLPLLLFIAYCNNSFCQTGTMTDPRDGKVYKTVQIGSQVWMAQNLSYIKGDGFVPATKEAVENREFELTTSYDRDSSYAQKFGRLYTWKTAQNVCPLGWHLPAKGEYDTLIASLGDGKNRFAKLISDWGGEKIFGGWLYMPGDLYIQRFLGLNRFAFFWTSTTRKKYNYVYSFSAHKNKRKVKILSTSKNCGLSVRCVKD